MIFDSANNISWGLNHPLKQMVNTLRYVIFLTRYNTRTRYNISWGLKHLLKHFVIMCSAGSQREINFEVSQTTRFAASSTILWVSRKVQWCSLSTSATRLMDDNYAAYEWFTFWLVLTHPQTRGLLDIKNVTIIWIFFYSNNFFTPSTRTIIIVTSQWTRLSNSTRSCKIFSSGLSWTSCLGVQTDLVFLKPIGGISRGTTSERLAAEEIRGILRNLGTGTEVPIQDFNLMSNSVGKTNPNASAPNSGKQVLLLKF